MGTLHYKFIEDVLLPHLNPFNSIIPWSVVIVDNASIHHIKEVIDIVENQAGQEQKWSICHHIHLTLTLLKEYSAKLKASWSKTVRCLRHAQH